LTHKPSDLSLFQIWVIVTVLDPFHYAIGVSWLAFPKCILFAKPLEIWKVSTVNNVVKYCLDTPLKVDF
jgi:hypothetical protein